MSTDGRNIRVNSLLCFLINKWKKIDIVRIRKSAMENFDSIDISLAKKQLLTDVELCEMSDKLPCYRERQATSYNELMAIKDDEMDDLLDALQLLDNQSLLGQLPLYAVIDIEKIPCVPLEHGELTFLSNKMARMEAIIEGMRVALCTLCNSTPKTGSSVHIHDSTAPAAQAGTMSKGGAQGMNLRIPPPGKPAATNSYTATQPTASASQMAARTVVTARKTRSSAVRAEHHDALMSTTSAESHDDDEGGWESGNANSKLMDILANCNGNPKNCFRI